jgi:hypothetical protein
MDNIDKKDDTALYKYRNRSDHSSTRQGVTDEKLAWPPWICGFPHLFHTALHPKDFD